MFENVKISKNKSRSQQNVISLDTRLMLIATD